MRLNSSVVTLASSASSSPLLDGSEIRARSRATCHGTDLRAACSHSAGVRRFHSLSLGHSNSDTDPFAALACLSVFAAFSGGPQNTNGPGGKTPQTAWLVWNFLSSQQATSG